MNNPSDTGQPRTATRLHVVRFAPAHTHPAWCDPSNDVHDVHQHGPGAHGSTIRDLLAGVLGFQAAIYQDPDEPPQILMGLNTYLSLEQARELAVNLLGLVEEAAA